jgi:hypothetical protein
MEEITKENDVKKKVKKVFKVIPWFLAASLGAAYYLLYRRRTEGGFISEYYWMHSMANSRISEEGELERV